MAASRSSKALDHLLDVGGPEAESIKSESGIHRTVLWRYRTGKGKPDADTVAILDRLTGGKVPANGWEDESPSDAGQPKSSESAA